ncbi:glycosyltransferase [Erythrobacter sp.]|uniref:glycosyltransferase n=1 Tax=Erythrobacter sp. TaxID=1042 RepID=UPI002EA82D36|nr:glycosyltransferase [Erythrobacter sp.]
MILVTVGMQLGFDRLIRAMDALAPELGMKVVAQTGRGEYRPANMEAHQALAPTRFEELASRARVLVSHAGIGTVLTAQRLGKPIVLMPRRADLGEHRNDHQVATVCQLAGRDGILVALGETELGVRIGEALGSKPAPDQPSPKQAQLEAAIRHFITAGSL